MGFVPFTSWKPIYFPKGYLWPACLDIYGPFRSSFVTFSRQARGVLMVSTVNFTSGEYIFEARTLRSDARISRFSNGHITWLHRNSPDADTSLQLE